MLASPLSEKPSTMGRPAAATLSQPRDGHDADDAYPPRASRHAAQASPSSASSTYAYFYSAFCLKYFSLRRLGRHYYRYIT